jgi:hypothetical protein
MGYMRHHAIIVTGSYGDYLLRAHLQARRLEMKVSDIVKSSINGFESFFVAPDGSKEGWPESDTGDIARDALIDFLQSMRYGDGGSPLSWALVQYGDDNRQKSITTDDDLIPPGSEIA